MDEHRSWTMSQVKSKDTTPEIVVRRLLHSMGYRYRLHGAQLPGKPDLVFSGRKKVLFVHGCFWHGHDCKRGARIPATRQEYWLAKVARNRERDVRNVSSLVQAGWSVMTVWECELKAGLALEERLRSFLGERSRRIGSAAATEHVFGRGPE
ncbi:very short patch repair endonuclease [Xaviernesmea rhizosphaerae]|uniref:very short patch repair endonuclease n=1 Tax=Xaviernesmea rhizosphaerae TaxID=1672749 RepID=UPI003159FCA0